MKASREEALSILSKWRNESLSVLVIFGIAGASLQLSGAITNVSSSLVTFRHGSNHFEFTIGLEEGRDFDYSDMREAPADVQESHGQRVYSRLSVEFASGAFCQIFEAAPKG